MIEANLGADGGLRSREDEWNINKDHPDSILTAPRVHINIPQTLGPTVFGTLAGLIKIKISAPFTAKNSRVKCPALH